MSPDAYAPVNKLWPSPMPSCSRTEATRAAQRLVKAFKGPRGAARVRRCWLALSPPYDDLSRGWRRLVHDVSHRVWNAQHPDRSRPHSGFHAALEREMAEYVVSHGWLDGKLKPRPKVKPTVADQREARLERARTNLAAWLRREKLAKTKVRRWRGRVRDLERYMAAVAAPRQAP